jgi:hypothetical protein
MTTEDIRPLTIADAIAIGDVLTWCQRNARLRWLTDNGDIAEGTARSVGDASGNFLRSTDDVRDSFVRITTATGWEWFPRMAEVIERHQAGTMVRDA